MSFKNGMCFPILVSYFETHLLIPAVISTFNRNARPSSRNRSEAGISPLTIFRRTSWSSEPAR